MKVAELNGTHLGQQFKLTRNGATLIDTLIGVEHEAEIVYDRTIGRDEPERTPGQRRTGLTFLQSGRYGTVNPDKIEVELITATPATGPSCKQHWLTEDHNADPKCGCGWEPEQMWPRQAPATRKDARDMVRHHIRAAEAQAKASS